MSSLSAALDQAPDINCLHCDDYPCRCPALPCAGALGEPCANPRKSFTTMRNESEQPECVECWRKRMRARCWR